jgi:multiple sugar transport system substrate-binding protein
VEAYNSSHKNQVELTIVPNDDYVAKVGAAAGSNGLPDLFAADIVYVPNWVDAGLFTDITTQIDGLPYAADLNPGHITAGTKDDKKYVMPFVIDASVLMWNKALYKEAGLDPDKGPTTVAEFVEQAKAVAALKKDGVTGTSFGGNCGGCLVFTWFPMLWASDTEVMNPEGTESLLASDQAKQVYAAWKSLVDTPNGVAAGSKEETGPTWVAGFQEGKVGVMPYPATLLSTADEALGKDNVGVAALPGLTGGGSSFAGGDGIGISKDSKVADQAWNFLAWLSSDDAQVEVIAKGGDVPIRADLSDNKYAQQDPRVVAINQAAAGGDTPVAMNFQEAFNAGGSPWVTLVQNAVFGDASSIDADNKEITAVLGG